MGTAVTGAVVVGNYGAYHPTAWFAIRKRKTAPVEAIVGSAEGTVINIGGDHDGRSKQSEKEKS